MKVIVSVPHAIIMNIAYDSEGAEKANPKYPTHHNYF